MDERWAHIRLVPSCSLPMTDNEHLITPNFEDRCNLKSHPDLASSRLSLTAQFYVPAKSAKTARCQKIWTPLHIEVCGDFLDKKKSVGGIIVGGSWNLRGDLTPFLWERGNRLSFEQEKIYFHNHVAGEAKWSTLLCAGHFGEAK